MSIQTEIWTVENWTTHPSLEVGTGGEWLWACMLVPGVHCEGKSILDNAEVRSQKIKIISINLVIAIRKDSAYLVYVWRQLVTEWGISF